MRREILVSNRCAKPLKECLGVCEVFVQCGLLMIIRFEWTSFLNWILNTLRLLIHVKLNQRTCVNIKLAYL